MPEPSIPSKVTKTPRRAASGKNSGFARGSSSSEWIRALSFVDHYYNNLHRGVVDVGDLLYYASLSILALFLGSQVLTARRWR